MGLIKRLQYKIKDSDRGEITLSKDVAARLEQYTRRPGSEGSLGELGLLLNNKGALSVVFNGSKADEFNDHHFIPPCGFWIKFLLDQLEQESRISRIFSFSITKETCNLHQERYISPIFEVKLEGFRVELDLQAVPISLKDQFVFDCNFKSFSKILFNAVATDDSSSYSCDTDNFEYLIDCGRVALESQMERRVEELQKENKYNIEARISSLQRGSQIRIDRLTQTISDHHERMRLDGKELSSKFILLKESQIATEKRRTEEKSANLQSKKELTLTLSLVAVVILGIH